MAIIETKEELENLFNTENLKTEDLKVVQCIFSEEETDEFGLVIGTTHFSTLYTVNRELATEVNHILDLTDVIQFNFKDHELTEAWKQSYLGGGISEDRWDRRTVFHPYNEMNEQFCIDPYFLEQILGKQEEIPSWKIGVIGFYRRHIHHTKKTIEQLNI